MTQWQMATHITITKYDNNFNTISSVNIKSIYWHSSSPKSFVTCGNYIDQNFFSIQLRILYNFYAEILDKLEKLPFSSLFDQIISWYRYVDDIYSLFLNNSILIIFFTILNTLRKNISIHIRIRRRQIALTFYLFI